MPESPLPNDSATRTPGGTIIDARDIANPTPTPTPTPTEPTPATTNEPPTPPDPASLPPDTYTFKAPEGQAVDQTLVDTFSPIFKDLGLTQAQADKLVDAQSKWAKSQADLTGSAIEAMGARWMSETQADPELGPNLDKIKVDIGRALDQTLKPDERLAFQKAMNDTMAGNNPAFVRAYWKLAQKIGPGNHVSGGGPSPNGQTAVGRTERPSVAASMWPSLKAS